MFFLVFLLSRGYSMLNVKYGLLTYPLRPSP